MNKRFIAIHVMLVVFLSAWAQDIGVKSSGLLWMTATPNIEVSYAINAQLSIHLPVQYNPFVFQENSRFQQLTTMPGARWWTNHCHAGTFLSAYGIATRYHVGGWLGGQHRYDGRGFGAGIGSGYSWIIGKRWNIEVEGGIGVIHTRYDKCGWQSNSKRFAHENGWRLIPTKYDVSLVYLF